MMYATYTRVSTKRQGRSGLGLEAQQEAIKAFLASRNGEVLPEGEFQEVESGAHNDRPQLAKAIARVRMTPGSTLLVAKLDRLSRDAEFILRLQRSGVPFVCADMPEADSTTIGIMAIIAQKEREMIRARTKAALARAKASGRPVGNPLGAAAFGENAGKGAVEARRRKAAEFVKKVGWAVQSLHDKGMTLRQIADRMNDMKVPARRGGQWSAATVKRVLDALSRAGQEDVKQDLAEGQGDTLPQ
ncbi:MAG: recombinase family protein [Desulfovibrio sp.]|nr:recombinase family protein [Desulfovibrio sp.]